MMPILPASPVRHRACSMRWRQESKAAIGEFTPKRNRMAVRAQLPGSRTRVARLRGGWLAVRSGAVASWAGQAQERAVRAECGHGFLLGEPGRGGAGAAVIDSGQLVLNSDWGKVQPGASEENDFRGSHSWEDYARWHLGLTDGPATTPRPGTRSSTGTSAASTAWASSLATTARPSGATGRSKLAAHELLQRLDNRRS